MSRFESEQEADVRADALNRELGASGPSDSFYVAAENPDGSWRVEKRTSEYGRVDRFFTKLVGLVRGL